VLVPLFEEDGETRVILTVRSGELRSHGGQVSFPGGRLEPGEGVVEGALREAAEEVALDPSLVEVVGRLSRTAPVVSPNLVTPVVGVLKERPLLVANPAEVARVFDVALADLVMDGVFHQEQWTMSSGMATGGSGEFPVGFFDVAGETVWGMTARTLVELLWLVLGGGAGTEDR
jgi:8-oxo-dGTP pyrophosphatase MutT (NUDIX family)